MPAPHGWQQSEVCEQPVPKNGMHFGWTQTPVASGLVCWQTRPGAHTSGGVKRFPPHGPPTPETQPHAVVAGDRLLQVAPAGHVPPHVPAASAPQSFTQRAAGPGQQLTAPCVSRQTHACSHCPPTQRSTVQGLPSPQSASLRQPGTVVEVVDEPRVVDVVEEGVVHRGLQISFGSRQGLPGEQGWPLHCSSTVTKQPALELGGGHSARQASFGRHGFAVPQACPVHRRSRKSKQAPLGGGGGQAAVQSWFGSGQALPEPQATPVQRRLIVSKHWPAVQGPSARLHTPASRRAQSFT